MTSSSGTDRRYLIGSLRPRGVGGGGSRGLASTDPHVNCSQPAIGNAMATAASFAYDEWHPLSHYANELPIKANVSSFH